MHRHNGISAEGGKEAIACDLRGAGDGVMLLAAVEDDYHEIGLLLFFNDASTDREFVINGRAGEILLRTAKLILAHRDKGDLDTVLLGIPRLICFLDILATAAMADACLVKTADRVKHGLGTKVTEVVVGEECTVKAALGQKAHLLGLTAQVGTALDDRCTKALLTDNVFQIAKAEIGSVQIRAQLREKLFAVCGIGKTPFSAVMCRYVAADQGANGFCFCHKYISLICPFFA